MRSVANLQALAHTCEREALGIVVHLVDGTYELFRHFYGMKRGVDADSRYGAVGGVLGTVLQMIDSGATHIGVATDHVIESFRNDLYHGYKTGEGIDPALWAQFWPLEEALHSLGIMTWPMIEFEADDALAAAAAKASRDARVEKVCIWTPDKDLAQCVEGSRVVQMDRRSGAMRDAQGVRDKFGVEPQRIPDYLALVGDSSDGYPGIAGIGAKTAARLIQKFGALEAFPDDVLGVARADALLFKQLATLRVDVPVFDDVNALAWWGAPPEFVAAAESLGMPRLAERASRAAHRIANVGEAR